MAQELKEIQADIIEQKKRYPALDVFEEPIESVTSVWKSFVHIVSKVIQDIQLLFDTHRADIDKRIADLRPHKPRWYRDKVLAFLEGEALIEDTDTYDTSLLTADEITAKQVVKYCAALNNGGKLLIKVAGANKTKLTTTQENAVIAYLEEVRDAGVDIDFVNRDADHYKASIKIWYDPMVLDGEGKSIKSGNEVARDAVNAYISNLPFNGEYSNMALIDTLQKVPGIKLASLQSAFYKYQSLDWIEITPAIEKVTPDSGYMKVYSDAELIFIYEPYVAN